MDRRGGSDRGAGGPARLKVRAGAAAILCALLAAGCAGQQEIETARQAEPPGAAFERGLYAGYLDLAESEAAQSDWIDAARFYDKALAVTRGERVEPERLEDRAIPADQQDDLAAARSSLIEVIDRGGADLAPEDSAAAQVAFDCWIEQQQEGFQTEDIAQCRAAFQDALERARAGTSGVIAVLLAAEGEPENAIAFTNDAGATLIDTPLRAVQAQAAAAPPTPPIPLAERTVDALFGDAIAAQPDDPVDYVLYFETGTATLTADSAGQIDGLIAHARGRPVTSVRVVGHTDTVGYPAVNAALSLRRAEQVRDLLVAGGLAADAIDVFSLGESNPLVPTPDDTPEARNRRVVVTVR
ncbi:MAG: OmpA family protein [Alphaproteobacteria bacterium]